MDNEQSGASAHHPTGDEGLSLEEEAVAARGREYRRHILAAAALRDIYTVGALATAVGVTPGTVHGWWRGAQPKAETLPKIARATGYRTDELYAWVYEAGEPPHFPESEEAEAQHRAARVPPVSGGSEAPRAPHEKAGSGRA